jgi:glycosyltransferase involved in cell wall biosynthesis
VIPCGVDTARFRPAGTSRAAERRIVCVARHAPVKNLGLLLDACAVLRARGVSFRCVSVGDGPSRVELEQQRRRLGLEETVEFAGAADQDEVLGWWQQAAVATLTSESEGMPVCLMEAAACGVPAVATAVGGVPELIRDGVTGLLTRPGDAEGLATAWQCLLENEERAALMGRAARRRVEEHFSIARQVDALLQLWEEFIV